MRPSRLISRRQKKNLGYGASGPEVFCTITQKQQHANSSSIRAIVQALQKTRLTYEPGQDVENFGNNMAKIACRTCRIGSAPIDLSTLFTTTYINCEVLALELKDKGLHDLVDRNPKPLSEDDIIRNLKVKTCPLKAQGLWNTSENKKVDTEVEIAGLKLAMKNLLGYHKRVQVGGKGRYQDRKVRDLSGITCFCCHNKGHFQDNCILVKKQLLGMTLILP